MAILHSTHSWASVHAPPVATLIHFPMVAASSWNLGYATKDQTWRSAHFDAQGPDFDSGTALVSGESLVLSRRARPHYAWTIVSKSVTKAKRQN
jgi:hypothetical protein